MRSSSATPPLRREDVHVHIIATPPCAKICPHNSGEGFQLRHAEGMKFAKDTLKFLCLVSYLYRPLAAGNPAELR